jgi:hypothetical protein
MVNLTKILSEINHNNLLKIILTDGTEIICKLNNVIIQGFQFRHALDLNVNKFEVKLIDIKNGDIFKLKPHNNDEYIDQKFVTIESYTVADIIPNYDRNLKLINIKNIIDEKS